MLPGAVDVDVMVRVSAEHSAGHREKQNWNQTGYLHPTEFPANAHKS